VEQSLEHKEIVPEERNGLHEASFEDAISGMCSEYLAWQGYMLFHAPAPHRVTLLVANDLAAIVHFARILKNG
jgi:hypothetical protein